MALIGETMNVGTADPRVMPFPPTGAETGVETGENQEAGEVQVKKRFYETTAGKVAIAAAAGVVLIPSIFFGVRAAVNANKPKTEDVQPGPDGGIDNPAIVAPETYTEPTIDKKYNIPLDVSLDQYSETELRQCLGYLEDVKGWDSAHYFKNEGSGNSFDIQCRNGLSNEGKSQQIATLSYGNGTDGNRIMSLSFENSDGIRVYIGNFPQYKENELLGIVNNCSWKYKDIVTISDIPSVAELQPKS